MGAALRPVLERQGVQAYFCGHEHNLQALRAPGEATQHVVSGGGSQVSDYGSEGGLRPEVQLFHPGSGEGLPPSCPISMCCHTSTRMQASL